MATDSLGAAKAAKNDEFYTQWPDIEREMNAYLDYDPDVFRGKTILLPCDDPEWSNFTKFFALHFTEYGLKKLISTSYAPDANRNGAYYAPTLFETEAPQFDPTRDMANGKLFVLEDKDISGDGRINIDDLQWSYLKGDGDFRSAEVTALRDEADIVITNPPFSLFREFVVWLTSGRQQFSVIGNPNAVTYRDVFPLVQANRLWWGVKSSGGQNMFMGAPDWYTKQVSAAKPQGAWWTVVDGNVLVGIKTVWYTNIEHGRRHAPLQLMTMEDNIRFNKKLKGQPYQHYDNYDAIEVPFTDAIPSDYDGVMGVPITFLDKYNPEQFELVTFRKSLDGEDVVARAIDDVGMSCSAVIQGSGPPRGKATQRGDLLRPWGDPAVNGRPMFKRLFIRRA